MGHFSGRAGEWSIFGRVMGDGCGMGGFWFHLVMRKFYMIALTDLRLPEWAEIFR